MLHERRRRPRRGRLIHREGCDRAKYHHTVEPLGATARDGATVVIGRVSGQFPGSPVELQHVFRLDGEEIASLEIR